MAGLYYFGNWALVVSLRWRKQPNKGTDLGRVALEMEFNGFSKEEGMGEKGEACQSSSGLVPLH